MIYLLDTIVLNVYLEHKNNYKYGKKCPPDVDINQLALFMENNIEHLRVPCTTLHELYAKCFLNPRNRSVVEPNTLELSQFIDDFMFIWDNEIKIINAPWEIYSFFNIAEWQNFLITGIGFEAETYIDEKIEYETQKIFQYFMLLCLVCGEVLYDTYGNSVNDKVADFFHKITERLVYDTIKKYLHSFYYKGTNNKQSKN